MIRVNLFFYTLDRNMCQISPYVFQTSNEAVISQRNIKKHKPSKNLKNLKKTKQIYYVILKMLLISQGPIKHGYYGCFTTHNFEDYAI